MGYTSGKLKLRESKGLEHKSLDPTLWRYDTASLWNDKHPGFSSHPTITFTGA
jgi:hypothetical protein